MSRYATPRLQPALQQAQPTIEGDAHFIGLQMKLDRDKLTSGYFARGENNRCNRGVLEPRAGTITPKFANVVAMTILGSGLYSNPNGQEVLLIATPNEVLRIKSGTYPASIALPSGVALAGAIEFAQHFDKVLLHRADGGTTLVWDGMAAAFSVITKSNPADTSTVLMPSAPWSVNFGNRAIFPTGPDTLGVSDLLDYTSYDAILHNFRINRGTSDAIVGVYPYANNSLVVGKTRGIDVLTGFIGDLNGAAMEVLSTDIGMAARRATKMVGGDLFFLCANPKGVFRVSEVIQDRLQAEPIPVSDAITPAIERINWNYASGAVAVVHGIYYILFAPIDGASVNNAAFVFNTVTKEWESAPDLWNPAGLMQVDDLQVTSYFGSQEIYAINKGPSSIHVLGLGSDDELSNGIYEINHVIETRGYATLGWNAALLRDFKRAGIPIETLRPSIAVTALTERAGDERVLTPTPITKNPLKYTIFDRADFVPGNGNNDFNAPGREDYSLDLADDFDLQAGVELEVMQQSVIPLATKIRGRYISYRVENTQGKCRVLSELVESAGAQRETRRAA